VIALDTNILVHAHRQDASLHKSAQGEVKKIAESINPWAICYHSLIEFYGIVTHPKIWKDPSSPEQAFRQIEAWRAAPNLRVLRDSAESLNQLQTLVIKAKVHGPLVHDARIAACCLSHGISELWTVDRDFSRFPALKTRNPLAF
jgi:toxin-antitoxin system PIN domain toxin